MSARKPVAHLLADAMVSGVDEWLAARLRVLPYEEVYA
jgi:hypothetical protein